MNGTTTNPASESSPKRPWMEPEVHSLDVAETAAQSGPGGDGGPIVDCTRS